MIEILSPGQSATKVVNKILYSLEQGMEMGWLVDPKERLILVYPSGQQPQSFEGGPAQLPVPTFASAISLSQGDVFGWLKL